MKPDYEEYERIVDSLYSTTPNLELPPEYNMFIQNNSLMMLIRLARYKFVAKMVENKDKLLEIGCGSGVGTLFLGQHVKSVTGIDINPRWIKEAERLNKRNNVSFLNVDFFSYDKMEKYDVVVCLDVIEHFEQEIGLKLIEKISNHLSDYGILILGTPSIYSYEFQSPQSKAAHIKLYNQEELASILEQYFGRILKFSMNDELVHTGFSKMSWYYFFISICPKYANI